MGDAERLRRPRRVAARWATIIGHAPAKVGLASGVVLADDLSGGAYAGKIDAPLVLIDPQSLSPSTAAYLAGLRQAKDLQSVEIFGGDFRVLARSLIGSNRNTAKALVTAR
jgi:hypothetical protein